MDHYVIKCTIPPNVTLGKSRISDIGVFSKKDFKKGDIIYENISYLVDLKKIPQKILLETDQGNYELDKNIHTSHYFEDQFLLYNFDSYTNHSCDPNTLCASPYEDDPLPYKCIALKDIKAGDEITADYNCFYYEVKDSFVCACGSQKCYGKVEGFKNLPIETQRVLVNSGDVDPSFIKVHKLEHLKN